MTDETSRDALDMLVRDLHHICGYYLERDRTHWNVDQVQAELWRFFWRYTAFVAQCRHAHAAQQAERLMAAVRDPDAMQH